MNFDSEYCCDRCKRRIKKGEEHWIGGKPFGEVCADIVRAHDAMLPTLVSVHLPDIAFGDFHTSGEVYILDVE